MGDGASASKSGQSRQAWSSGRVLTQEQRERKRAVNRSTARVRKKDIQERVAYLETKLGEVEQWKRDIMVTLSNLGVNVVETGQLPGAVHAEPLQDIEDAEKFGTDWESGLAAPPMPSFRDMSEVSPSYASPSESHNLVTGSNIRLDSPELPRGSVDLSSEAQRQNSVITEDMQDPGRMNIMGGAAATVELPPAPPLSMITAQGRDITEYLNNLVLYTRSLQPELVCFDDACNQDLLIRAVLQGWERTFTAYLSICPLWRLLRQVDLVLFKSCGLLERIAMLRTVHLKGLSECASSIENKQRLPAWYMPRPSQEVFGHDPVVDHIAWPGMRDKLTICENNTLTNKFWAIFAKEFRFGWSQEPLKALVHDGQTQQYHLSDEYSLALTDISHWRMSTRFCTFFPEFSADISPADYMPLLTTMPSTSYRAASCINASSNPYRAEYNNQGIAEADEKSVIQPQFRDLLDPG